MFLRKLCLYAMLATVLALAAPGTLNRYIIKKAGASETNAQQRFDSHHRLSRRKPATLPAYFLPVQFKNAKSLGAGKVLVASRNLGDPRFAKTVSSGSRTTPKAYSDSFSTGARMYRSRSARR